MRNDAKMRARLIDAWKRKFFVRFTRPQEPGRVRGAILGVGPEFFMVAIVADSMRYDGFQCFRIHDVREFEAPDLNTKFVRAAHRKLGVRKPRTPRINLNSLESLLKSAGKIFPLVTIHIENVDPDVCFVGKVDRVKDGRLSLREIRPNAAWWPKPFTYRLNQITRVDVGGDYEYALYLVGGPPPEQPSQRLLNK